MKEPVEIIIVIDSLDFDNDPVIAGLGEDIVGYVYIAGTGFESFLSLYFRYFYIDSQDILHKSGKYGFIGKSLLKNRFIIQCCKHL
ncbi:MAG: hypothetical protein GY757_16050 [bacterium]|nr:hypothetical protein [bacterium]